MADSVVAALAPAPIRISGGPPSSGAAWPYPLGIEMPAAIGRPCEIAALVTYLNQLGAIDAIDRPARPTRAALAETTGVGQQIAQRRLFAPIVEDR